MESKLKIAILGGTGALGSGFAKRWATAGHPIIIGSRSKDKAAEFARSISTTQNMQVSGEDMLTAARLADVVLLAVPFSSHEETLKEIKEEVQGKIVIDAVVPLVPPKVSTVQLPKEGSASVIAQQILGDQAQVVAAYHNVGAAKLQNPGPVDCDVLICGNEKEARDTVIALTETAGLRGIDAGLLANAVAAEALTSILIGINRRYKVDCAGIRITGLDSVKST